MGIRASGIGDEDWSESISRSERVLIISTDKDDHFTEAITQNNHEKESLTGLESDKIYIRGVNIQADQALKFRLIFWSKDTFENSDIDEDSFLDYVDLDLATHGYQIAGSGQYYLNSGDLAIVYEDKDETRELHMSLMNLGTTSKNAGASGEVQLDIKYGIRL